MDALRKHLNLEDEFKEWMGHQEKQGGGPYREDTIRAYVYALRSNCSKMDGDFQGNTNLFTETSYQNFMETQDKIRRHPDFEAVNQKAGNGAFSAGMSLYAKFLQEREQSSQAVNSNEQISISTQQWSEMLLNPQIFYPENLTLLQNMVALGGHATCSQLSKKFGGHPTGYISPVVALAKRIQGHMHCAGPVGDDGKINWWNIPFIGQYTDDHHFDWQIRPELLEAIKNSGQNPDNSKSTESANEMDKISNADFLKWFSPLLQALRDLGGSATPAEVREKIVRNCHLSKEEIEETRGKNNQNKFQNNVAWARNYLKDEGYLDGSEYGIWKLTERGWHVRMTDELASRIFFKWVEILNCRREGSPEPNIDLTGYDKIEANQTYSKKNFLSDVFWEEESYDTLKALLLRKKNLVLQGAPGVGKTYAAKRLAWSVMGEKDESRICFVQFHQSYSYEDFVMGYRPDHGGFTLKPGVFYRFSKQAEQDPDHRPYFFLIDEINRGNLSKIFGELLMLIECDKRGMKIDLTYGGEPFSVPDNLYLIGMMNTADRSLAIIDYALRRRFCFFELEPAFTQESFQTYLKKNGVSEDLCETIIRRMTALNAEIAGDPNLGRGFRIGHSYFCDCRDCSERWYRNIITYEIAPLLREYWFDDGEKTEALIDKLLG